MRIELDRARCTGIGICESLAPDLFEVDEDGDLLLHSEEVPAGSVAAAQAAEAGCPTSALRLLAGA